MQPAARFFCVLAAWVFAARLRADCLPSPSCRTFFCARPVPGFLRFLFAVSSPASFLRSVNSPCFHFRPLPRFPGPVPTPFPGSSRPLFRARLDPFPGPQRGRHRLCDAPRGFGPFLAACSPKMGDGGHETDDTWIAGADSPRDGGGELHRGGDGLPYRHLRHGPLPPGIEQHGGHAGLHLGRGGTPDAGTQGVAACGAAARGRHGARGAACLCLSAPLRLLDARHDARRGAARRAEHAARHPR